MAAEALPPRTGAAEAVVGERNARAAQRHHKPLCRCSACVRKRRQTAPSDAVLASAGLTDSQAAGVAGPAADRSQMQGAPMPSPPRRGQPGRNGVRRSAAKSPAAAKAQKRKSLPGRRELLALGCSDPQLLVHAQRGAARSAAVAISLTTAAEHEFSVSPCRSDRQPRSVAAPADADQAPGDSVEPAEPVSCPPAAARLRRQQQPAAAAAQQQQQSSQVSPEPTTPLQPSSPSLTADSGAGTGQQGTKRQPVPTVSASVPPAETIAQLPAGDAMEPAADPAKDAAAALIARIAGALTMPPGAQVGLRQVMASGLMAGEALNFCDRQKLPRLSGVVSEKGLILCGCKACSSSNTQWSSSEWEVHAGSRERRPAESIYLVDSSMSLRELCIGIQNFLCGKPPEIPARPVACHCSSCGRSIHGLPSQLCRQCTAAAKGAARKAANSVSTKAKTPSGKAPSGKAKSGKAKVHLAQPTALGVPLPRSERNSHRHRKLFTGQPGAVQNGERLDYKTAAGEWLLGGVAVVSDVPGTPSGILCDCCNNVISCSQFEAHAGKGSRRAPYDNIYTPAGISLRKLADTLQGSAEEAAFADPGSTAGIANRCGEMISGLEEVGGGCALCHSPDFLRGAFGERTMLLCDQCEREFHVGCLRSSGRATLDSIPAGEWFCSSACGSIHETLQAHVLAGPMPLSGEHTWQLLRGKNGTHATTWALKAAQDILSESFDPIIDIITSRDMLAMMVQAQAAGPWDYSGMHVALLRHKGKPAAAALVRVFGPQLAELPLVATRMTARRQGHARVLVAAVENLLTGAGVQCLSLPAAQETVGTWMHGFGFGPMPEEQLQTARTSLRILIFPGSEILSKRLSAPLSPTPLPPPSLPRKAEAGTVAAVLEGALAAEATMPDADQATALEIKVEGNLPQPAAGSAPSHSSPARSSPSESQRDVIKRRKLYRMRYTLGLEGLDSNGSGQSDAAAEAQKTDVSLRQNGTDCTMSVATDTLVQPGVTSQRR